VLALLRVRRERPHRSRATEQRDDFAPCSFDWLVGTTEQGHRKSVPSALAVFRLIYIATLVACCTGKLALSPAFGRQAA
jgi:hypothetical protein